MMELTSSSALAQTLVFTEVNEKGSQMKVDLAPSVVSEILGHNQTGFANRGWRRLKWKICRGFLCFVL